MRVGLTLNTKRSSIGFTRYTETTTYGVYVFFATDDATERAHLAVVWVADRSTWHASPPLIVQEFAYTPRSAVSETIPWQPLARYNITTCEMRQVSGGISSGNVSFPES